MLEKFQPRYESYLTECRKYEKVIRSLKAEKKLLEQEAKENKDNSIKRRMEIAQQLADYENLRTRVEKYAPELLSTVSSKQKFYGRE